MKSVSLTAVLILTINILFSFTPRFMSDPAISPDGENICFVYQYDLWTVNFNGGIAHRLTSTEANESGPVFSPDGKYIAYSSNKTGIYSVYIIPTTGGKSRLITEESGSVIAWYPDGKSLLLTKKIPGKPSFLIKININNLKISEVAGIGDFYGDISKDSKHIIYNKHGYPYREKYKGTLNGDLWEINLISGKYTQLTDTPFTERYPKYSYLKDDIIYFCQPIKDVFQLMKVTNHNFTQPEQLTHFKTWSVRDISISKNTDRIVFEHFDKIWKYNPKTKKSSELKITINEDCFDSPIVQKNIIGLADTYSVSPDGKWIAFSYKYDLFAVPTKGGDVKQLTFTQNGIDQITIMKDNKTIYFTSFVKGNPELFSLSITDSRKIKHYGWENVFINRIKCGLNNQLYLSLSFKNKSSRLAVFNPQTENYTLLIKNKVIWTDLVISPDSTYALYAETKSETFNRELYLYDFKTKKSKKIFENHGWIGNIFWGKDGTSVFFNISKNIVRLDLYAKNDFISEKDNWKQIVNPSKQKKEKSKIKNRTKIDFENIDTRISTIIDKDGWNYVIAVPNDSIIYYYHSYQNKKQIRSISYFGKHDNQLISLQNSASDISYNHSSKSFFAKIGNRLFHGNSSIIDKAIKYEFHYNYDKYILNKNIFYQVWRAFGNGFYDSNMHKTNWNKIRTKYAQFSKYLINTSTLEMVVDEMIGEVNASHTGFYPRDESKIKNHEIAFIGAEFDYYNIPEKGIRIKKVYFSSKLNQPYMIKKGNILISIDGQNIDKNHTLNSLLSEKVNKKIKLTFKTNNKIKTIIVKGLSYSQQSKLQYDNWVKERENYVNNWSKGKIGYLHIKSMNEECLKKFRQDLYTKNYNKKALIIDVRNNGGGRIHDDLIEELTKKSYGILSRRYMDSKKVQTPANVFSLPKVVLINENSFSDAEIFPHLVKELNLATIIGVATSGSVIGTSPHKLMDGSSMRMPSNGWWLLNKTNMETNGCQPDITVKMSPEDIIKDNDVQLKKAVSELLKRIK
jgi:C-terminal processing protease CtpA/Prc/Tol biopolymer transport system component